MFAKLFFFLVVVVASVLIGVSGHGVLIDPPNRSTLWRYDPGQPVNYNDNELFCGGALVQYEINGGRCGICGDSFSDPRPRANENGGIFGNGIIVRNYPAGSIIEVQINLTANHLGTFSYSVCKLQHVKALESEECFQDLLLVGGKPVHRVLKEEVLIIDRVQLPENLRCNQCVFRWHYSTGNSWGICDDGSQGVGCGPQETFRACADIAII